jgi:hypothetical protein
MEGRRATETAGTVSLGVLTGHGLAATRHTLGAVRRTDGVGQVKDRLPVPRNLAVKDFLFRTGQTIQGARRARVGPGPHYIV